MPETGISGIKPIKPKTKMKYARSSKVFGVIIYRVSELPVIKHGQIA